MRRCHLVDQEITDEGVLYRASDEAAGYIELLETRYSERLKECADWIADQVRLNSKVAFYREPLKSRHGALSDDEKTIKASGVKEHFFAYLKEKTEFAQFIIIENDPPPSDAGSYAKVHAFVGDEGDEGRKGFF
jgi:hypothetical protein